MKSSGRIDDLHPNLVNLRFLLTLCVLYVLGGSLFAQNYQVNWSVVDIGGSAMSSISYRASASVGQTAAGQMSGTNYQSFIGFWQIDTSASGVREESHWSVTEPLATQLYTPFPNPCPAGQPVGIRYSLATAGHVTIQLFDLTGRNVRTLVDARQKPGRYSVRTSEFGPRASRLGPGIYFLKMKTTGYQATRKLLLL